LEILIDLYIADVERFWSLGIKEMPSRQVACIDSSSLGWRLLTRKTYFPKGGSQDFANQSFVQTYSHS
jgi:hypothetical protein